MSNIIEVVKDHLDRFRNVSPEVLEGVPMLVERAVIQLQGKNKILPPKVLEFKSQDKKNEKKDTSFDTFFTYFFLPKDFIELDELFVYDSKGADQTTGVPYQWTPYENYISKLQTNSNRKWFTITDIEDSTGEYRKILIMNPYPADDIFIRVKYYVDGTEDSLKHLSGSKYWEPIIMKVEELLGIRSKEDSNDFISDEVTTWRNQQGKSPINNTPTSTKPKFFGKSARLSRQKHRLR